MPCYYPRKMYEPLDKYGNVFEGRWVFKEPKNYVRSSDVPCKQCIGCRLAKSMEWGARAAHEAQMHQANCFITLTYAPGTEPLVPFSSKPNLNLKHFQHFMKRLRKKISPQKIRILYCGEYGDQYGRPHYHAIIFGYDFPDKTKHRISDRGDVCYRSATLEQLWPFGFSEISAFSYDLACYVARYTLKKQTGKKAESHYRAGFDPDTGELFYQTPEFMNMSRDGGIGLEWLLKYSNDVYTDDFVVLSSGKKLPPPKFYDNKYFEILVDNGEAQRVDTIVHNRYLKSQLYVDNNTPARLAVREQVQLSKQNSLVRPLL